MRRNPIRILLIVAVSALFAVPIVAIAAAGFTDVDAGSVFVSDIQWMKDNGVTKGCNPPANTKYCPKNDVTREQMSAFMHRLAVNQVVDAGAVDGYDADGIVAAYAWDIGGFDDITAATEVFSGMVTAPTAGVLIVNASLWMEDDSSLAGAGNARVTVSVGGTQIAVGRSSFSLDNGDNFDNTVSLSSGIEIPAGASEITITVSGGSGVWLGDGSVNAVFTPFGGAAYTLAGEGIAPPSEQP